MFVVEFEDALKTSFKNRNRIRVRPRKKISPASTQTSSCLTESSNSSSRKVPSWADQMKLTSSSGTACGGPNNLGFQDDDDDENVPAYVDVHGGKVGDSDDSDENSSSSD
jgi:hypothetical protein